MGQGMEEGSIAVEAGGFHKVAASLLESLTSMLALLKSLMMAGELPMARVLFSTGR